jgi:hypothetical protein
MIKNTCISTFNQLCIPLLFTTVCHLSISFSSPHLKSLVGFEVMNVTAAFLRSFLFANFLESK